MSSVVLVLSLGLTSHRSPDNHTLLINLSGFPALLSQLLNHCCCYSVVICDLFLYNLPLIVSSLVCSCTFCLYFYLSCLSSTFCLVHMKPSIILPPVFTCSSDSPTFGSSSFLLQNSAMNPDNCNSLSLGCPKNIP